MKTTTLLLLAGVFFTGNVFAPTKSPTSPVSHPAAAALTIDQIKALPKGSHTIDAARIAAAKAKSAAFEALAKTHPELSAPDNDEEWDIASFATEDGDGKITAGELYFEHENVVAGGKQFAGRIEKAVADGRPNTPAEGDGGYWNEAPPAYKAIFGNIKPKGAGEA